MAQYKQLSELADAVTPLQDSDYILVSQNSTEHETMLSKKARVSDLKDKLEKSIESLIENNLNNLQSKIDLTYAKIDDIYLKPTIDALFANIESSYLLIADAAETYLDNRTASELSNQLKSIINNKVDRTYADATYALKKDLPANLNTFLDRLGALKEQFENLSNEISTNFSNLSIEIENSIHNNIENIISSYIKNNTQLLGNTMIANDMTFYTESLSANLSGNLSGQSYISNPVYVFNFTTNEYIADGKQLVFATFIINPVYAIYAETGAGSDTPQKQCIIEVCKEDSDEWVPLIVTNNPVGLSYSESKNNQNYVSIQNIWLDNGMRLRGRIYSYYHDIKTYALKPGISLKMSDYIYMDGQFRDNVFTDFKLVVSAFKPKSQ